MSVSLGFTAEQIWAFVHEYEVQPYGTKGAWLAKQGVTSWTMRRWRTAVFEGDVDLGLMPREGVPMTLPPDRRRAFERKRAAEIAAHEAETDRLQVRIRELEAANDALGKAIGLLHAMSEHEPVEQTPPTDELTDS